MHAKVRTE